MADISSGEGGSSPGTRGMEILVGDTIYFSAYDDATGFELWAHDTSNSSTWQVADLNRDYREEPVVVRLEIISKF